MKTIKIKPVDSQQLSDRAKFALISIIQENGKDGKPFKLPNEDELASRLNVSRNVLRDALMSLEEMGIVTRRRSKGTMASPYIANAVCRLGTDPEIGQTLIRAGYKTSFKTLFFDLVYDESPVSANAFPNLVSKKLFRADGVPVAYIEDKFISRENIRREDFIHLRDFSHKDILEKIYETPLAYTLSHIDAILPTEEIRQLLEIDSASPVISLLDEGFNYDHERIVVTHTYFRAGTIDLKILRKSW